ncbi:MAG: hypothetical protein H7839_00355 [Magnetococcus sp. YQC-5]
MRILYRQHHLNRLTEVVEDGECRSLTFNTHLTQSRMLLADPVELVLGYSRCMMAALLFDDGVLRDGPMKILMIGLGGGSLVKFLLHHYPGCRMDVVEEDPAMPALAREFFHLPDDPRLTLYLEDGARFLERVTTGQAHRCYDLLLVDAYDQEGMAQSVYAEAFFTRAYSLLTRTGVMAVNLIRSDAAHFRQCTTIMGKQFPEGALEMAVAGSNNEIYFVGPGIALWEDRQELVVRAWDLESRLEMNFPVMLQDLVRVKRPTNWRQWFGWQ